MNTSSVTRRFHILYASLLFLVAVFAFVSLIRAATPNPGHSANEVDFPVVTKTGSYTIVAADTVILADASSGAFTLTLPSAVGIADDLVFIKKIDTALANLVTITRSGSETIDGLASISLAQRGESVILQSDGANWRILMRRDYDISSFRTKGSTLNQWYTSPTNGTALTTGALTANRLYAIPFIVTKVMTVDQMSINVTTLGSGSSVRVGIYADNGNNYPGALVVDGGSVSTATLGVKTYTAGLPATLDAGLYWLAIVSNATAPTIRSFAVASLNPILGYASSLPTNAQFGWFAAFTFGSLPSTFTAGGTAITAVPIPAVFVRASQ